jgi:hypothetical protein
VVVLLLEEEKAQCVLLLPTRMDLRLSKWLALV